MQCRPNPGILGSIPPSCPIRGITLPVPGPANSIDKAKITFQQPASSMYNSACTCSVRSVDESGCVSLPSNEALVHQGGMGGPGGEHAAVTLILFGCVLGAICLVALCSLLWIGRTRVRGVATRAAIRRREQLERFFMLANQVQKH